MALRAVNLLSQQAPPRTAGPSTCPLSVYERLATAPVTWRSSCSARVPCRLSKQFPARCAAMAPPQLPPAWSIDTDCEEVMGRLRDTENLKDCLGAPLTDDEQRSLVRCLDSARLGVDTCLVDGLSALRDHLMSYIEAVSVSQTDDLELVEGAMLLIEQLTLVLTPSSTSSTSSTSTSTSAGSAHSSAHHHRHQSEEGLSNEGASGLSSGRFSGQWQVLVTTSGGWPYGRLQYVPIFELLEISEDGRQFRLESKAGPLYTFARGEVSWRHQQYDHLQYHATEFRVEMYGISLTLPPPTPDNDLRVFAATPSTALARSGTGGMQLMGRPL